MNNLDKSCNRDMQTVNALFGDIKYQINSITTPLDELNIDNTQTRNTDVSENIVRTSVSEMKETQPHMTKARGVSDCYPGGETKPTGRSEHMPSIMELPNPQANFIFFHNELHTRPTLVILNRTG